MAKTKVKGLATPSDLSDSNVEKICKALNPMLADIFALYMKTKNFHWHMSGPEFRDYHLLLDQHSEQLFAVTDDLAERMRKIGGITLHSIGEIAKLQRIKDNDKEFVKPMDMLAELREDNKNLTANFRKAHEVCNKNDDFASASLIENWIDEAERRTWFLYEVTRHHDSSK